MEGAELAGVVGALGAAGVLLAWERWLVVGGLAVLALAEAGLLFSMDDGETSPTFAALGARAISHLPHAVAIPAAAFIGFAAVSLTWTSELDAGASTLAYFLLPFATLLAITGRAAFPPWMPRALAIVGVALAAVFAAVGLWQAVTRDLLFFSPSVEVGN